MNEGEKKNEILSQDSRSLGLTATISTLDLPNPLDCDVQPRWCETIVA
jgi:hypothetical protein